MLRSCSSLAKAISSPPLTLQLPVQPPLGSPPSSRRAPTTQGAGLLRASLPSLFLTARSVIARRAGIEVQPDAYARAATDRRSRQQHRCSQVANSCERCDPLFGYEITSNKKHSSTKLLYHPVKSHNFLIKLVSISILLQNLRIYNYEVNFEL
jgi:hypothetical protein